MPVLKFQFLVVRLKALLNRANVDLQKFQFLVVRLKVLPLERKRKPKPISIPCGSIKSNQAEADALALIIFQFLVVRLKVCGGCQSACGIFISIPCGSIKRMSILIFRFPICNFNSLWFD